MTKNSTKMVEVENMKKTDRILGDEKAQEVGCESPNGTIDRGTAIWMCPVFGCPFSTDELKEIVLHSERHGLSDEVIKRELARFREAAFTGGIACGKALNDPENPIVGREMFEKDLIHDGEAGSRTRNSQEREGRQKSEVGKQMTRLRLTKQEGEVHER